NRQPLEGNAKPLAKTGKQTTQLQSTFNINNYHDADTDAAVTIGIGTNACYLERTDAIIKCQGPVTASGSMAVNMEWGNFWSSHLPITNYDISLIAERPNPYDQVFEKMIFGMYLGDIVRRVILRMTIESDIFGPLPSRLVKHFILTTPLVAKMHEDDSPDLKEVAHILKKTFGISEAPLKVRKLVVRICYVVTRRGARLASVGIVGILKKIGRDGTGGITSGHGGRSDIKMKRTVVAIESGLYTSYRMFRDHLHEAFNELLGEEVAQHVILKATEDGSGIGAALLAASYSSCTVHRVHQP
ncbi:hexokinase-3-like, partial [Mercurialis annua]|uniref:hexokinase-3-like n=1 Tax=Mercurialis annua TaxID=3986 RepID=UPI002160E49E